MALAPSPPSPTPGPLRRELARLCLTVTLALGLLLPLALLDRPPARPRLTLIGGGDGLSVLLEGAGGGRVLLGGGGTQADVPASLGRHLRPWDRRLDLLLVADGRDLPGAIALVRHGDVRAVATLGLEGARPLADELAALREACAARAIPLQAIEGAERIRVGRDASVTLDVLPALGAGEGAALRLAAGPFSATVFAGTPAPADAATGAILLRGGQETYRAALAAGPGLVIAPAPPPAAVAKEAGGGRLLVIGPGERATFTLTDRGLRLRGPAIQPLQQ